MKLLRKKAYQVVKPAWLKYFYGNCIWDFDESEKVIYLTFDDGPHPSETPFVLQQLNRFGAKATFFCIGQNVQLYNHIYQQILEDGHTVGNHTYHHLNGWKTSNTAYYADIAQAQQLIKSSLFRPPFGRITPRQAKHISMANEPLQVIMWSIMSGDFDADTTPEQCYQNMLHHIKPGSVVVMHDNDLAAKNLRFALPKVLEAFSEKGYQFKAIPQQTKT